MKIVIISDTHGKHNQLDLSNYEGDMIICCGDITNNRHAIDVHNFLNWFKNLDQFKYKILIAGNHDFYFDTKSDDLYDTIPENIIYLCDNMIEIEGIKIYGTPQQPIFFNWAFNRTKEELIEYFNQIPDDVDILITHTPPLNILDKVYRGNVGCDVLSERLKHIKPKLHCFGHIHESYGILIDGETTYVNASLLNERYLMTNKPIIFDYLVG